MAGGSRPNLEELIPRWRLSGVSMFAVLPRPKLPARWPGIGEFLAEVDRAFAQIRLAPERWPLWRPDRPYHQRLLRRFPFMVLYRVTAEYVRVAALAHMSRRPGYWAAP
jgi:hypothetical protein